MADQNEVQLPDMFDISGDAQTAADAAMDPQPKPPATAAKAVAKNGDEYFRWSELLSIDNAAMSRSPKGHTCLLVVGKIRPSGDPTNKNIGKKVFTRVFISFPTLADKLAGRPVDEKLDGMNNRSIGTLNSLLRSTGFMPDKPGLSAALLRTLFPLADNPTSKSPLLGKIVVGNLVQSPNKGEGARTPTNVSAESFLAPPSGK